MPSFATNTLISSSSYLLILRAVFHAFGVQKVFAYTNTFSLRISKSRSLIYSCVNLLHRIKIKLDFIFQQMGIHFRDHDLLNRLSFVCCMTFLVPVGFGIDGISIGDCEVWKSPTILVYGSILFIFSSVYFQWLSRYSSVKCICSSGHIYF